MLYYAKLRKSAPPQEKKNCLEKVGYVIFSSVLYFGQYYLSIFLPIYKDSGRSYFKALKLVVMIYQATRCEEEFKLKEKCVNQPIVLLLTEWCHQEKYTFDTT